jgi:hypothetical protein
MSNINVSNIHDVISILQKDPTLLEKLSPEEKARFVEALDKSGLLKKLKSKSGFSPTKGGVSNIE